jgi:hypothetical protein
MSVMKKQKTSPEAPDEAPDEVPANMSIVVAQRVGVDCTDAQLAELVSSSAAAEAKCFDASTCTALSAKGLGGLQNLPSCCTELLLKSCELCPKMASALAKLIKASALLTLDVSDNAIVRATGTGVMEQDQFGEGELEVMKYDFAGIRAVAAAIRTNPCLSALVLSGNLVMSEGLDLLAKALKQNTSLTCLDLAGCFLVNSSGGDGRPAELKGISVFLKLLSTTKTLQSIDLSDNALSGCCGPGGFTHHAAYGPDPIQRLVLSLSKNTTLLSLNLSKNGLRRDGAVVLAEYIKANTSLLSLDISCNQLYLCGMYSFSSSCNEGEADLTGVCKFFEALQQNT